MHADAHRALLMATCPSRGAHANHEAALVLRRCVRSSHWPLRPFVSVQRSPTHRQTGIGHRHGRDRVSAGRGRRSKERRPERWDAERRYTEASDAVERKQGTECEHSNGQPRGVCG